MEPDTCLEEVSEESFNDYYRSNPARVYMVLEQISHNLRRQTKDYLDACRKLQELTKEEQA